ncbi:Peptidase M14 and/or Propep M14 domain containing protein [Asbolus verrucosus]|uniref:Zinc carboxypeptidase A 1 n=1 Tax=Asbolus verrucosus TaxID=1661398 RepID=A0A482VX28_ASBVE|nr:Peptidase M14 and/or Propep M14 domain containing protein [Asbolus verrucosus]
MKTLIVLLTIIVQIFGHEKVRYDNYQVYRVTPRTQENLKFLKYLEDTSSDFSFWTNVKAINHNVDVMVSPDSTDNFQDIINNNYLESKIIIPNVQKLIDNERNETKTNEDFGWTDYYTLEKINVWLSNLAEQYADNVSLIKGGTSYEGRDIIGVHVSFAPGNENKSVFVDGNIHACEWISSAVVTYILNQLLTNTDPNVRQVAESHDWYIFPVINPDGFVYTHTTDRAWRKTRVPHGDTCVGADPNRNWGYHYNEGGANNDPCSNNYCGPEAFSEPSMKSLSEFISAIGESLEGYISFHSYSQILLLPYGYTPDHLDNYDELYAVGLKAIDALAQRYGTEYRIDIASGGSPDWIKGTFGTRITYIYELRDTGENGFLLPAEQILPTAEETFDSFITIFQDFWTSVKTINHNVDVMVPPYGIDKFEKIIRYYGLDTKMIIPNVQNLIDNERRKINVWLSNLAEKYSDNVTLVKGGTSYEGRDIVGVRDRLWRKTRVPYGDCVGVDANRNWGYHFNEGGTSDDPCSSMYCGPEAFSEPSMKSLSEYISTIGDNLEGYISFHSYSQVLLIPYGYTTEHLDNFDELINAWLTNLTKASDVLSLVKGGTSYEGRDIIGVRTDSLTLIQLIAYGAKLEYLTATPVSELILIATGVIIIMRADCIWRKTEVPYDDTCVGADPNRNWGYHYNESGTSGDPCSNSYRKPEAFSDPPAKGLSEYISIIGQNLQGYIAFHSYFQYEVGSKAIDVLPQRYGTKYKILQVEIVQIG